MDPSSREAQIAGARAYEALHVPALFAQWCPRLLDAASVTAGQRVLDVACGTGVLARAAAARVGPSGRVSGVDPGIGMLAVARELAPGVEWTEGVAESLPYPDEAFDAVVSQFGLMFVRDRARAVGEMHRVLRPDGELAVAVWDSLERSGAYPQLVSLLERRAGPAAADALRAPFVLGDADALVALFEAGGLVSVRVVTEHGTARFPDIRTLVEADLRGWLPVMGVPLSEAQIENILDEADTVLAPCLAPDGSVRFDAPAHLVTARARPR